MRKRVVLLAGALMWASCGPDIGNSASFEAAEAGAILALVNDPTIGLEELDIAVGLDRRAAQNIIAHRDGADRIFATEDDRTIESLEALNAIPNVGQRALHLLLAFAVLHDYGILQEAIIPEHPGVRFSENVFREVAAIYTITDGENLLVRALTQFNDGNAYLNRQELVSAASALAQDREQLRGYTFSETVVREVMHLFGLADRLAFLVEVIPYDEDRYLNRQEFVEAARPMGHGPEIGIISDIDTILPLTRGAFLPAAHPGVALLYQGLEYANEGQAGDTHYVTARSHDRVAGLPEWLHQNGLPAGPIETGIGQEPWVAEPEKVSDIATILDRRLGQRFVLFGDTNHRDPEVYAEIMRRYPDRIAAVFIHNVSGIDADRTDAMYLINDFGTAAEILQNLDLLEESIAARVIEAVEEEDL